MRLRTHLNGQETRDGNFQKDRNRRRKREDVWKIGKRELLTDHQWCGQTGLL